MGKSVSEIKAIREQTMQALGNRVGNDDGIIYIMTCCGTGCTSSGSLKDRDASVSVRKARLLWSFQKI